MQREAMEGVGPIRSIQVSTAIGMWEVRARIRFRRRKLMQPVRSHPYLSLLDSHNLNIEGGVAHLSMIALAHPFPSWTVLRNRSCLALILSE